MRRIESRTMERIAATFRRQWAGGGEAEVTVWEAVPAPDRPGDLDPARVWVDVEGPPCPGLPPKWQLWIRRKRRAEFPLPRARHPDLPRPA